MEGCAEKCADLTDLVGGILRIAAVGRGLPTHYYDQETLGDAIRRHFAPSVRNPKRIESILRNVLVGGRHMALAIDEYPALKSFGDANDAYIREAVPLGEQAIEAALDAAGLTPHDVDHLVFTTVTGLAVPSIDARLVNRMGFRPDVKRTPLFGLGCVGGAVGITRLADVLRGFPDQVGLLLSVELCSLTLQQQDASVANLIASGLFGDGAAAVVMLGRERAAGVTGPRVVATRSIFHPHTERAMGWEVSERGFRVVLSAEVPDLARGIRPHVDSFLAEHGIALSDIGRFICHPGGPKVLEALEEALDLDRDDTLLTWQSLWQLGNLSSASVLFVLGETLARRPAEPGTYGILFAMGPGFCSELVLLRW